MVFIYYPDIDTLDLYLSAEEEKGLTRVGQAAQDSADPSRPSGTETHEADPSGQTLAHYREDCLEELTIEHASRRAPATWGIESLRREAAQVATTTGRIVESVTHDLRRDRTSFQTGDLGPHSPHTSDEAVREYNQMIDEIETASAAA